MSHRQTIADWEQLQAIQIHFSQLNHIEEKLLWSSLSNCGTYAMRKLAPHPLLQQLASGPGLSPHPHINPTKYSKSMNAIIEPSAMLAYHLKNIQQNHGYQLIISSMILLQKSLDAPVLHCKIHNYVSKKSMACKLSRKEKTPGYTEILLHSTLVLNRYRQQQPFIHWLSNTEMYWNLRIRRTIFNSEGTSWCGGITNSVSSIISISAHLLQLQKQ